MKEMGIDQKVAIVTGASSGIGRAAALKFANEGAQLVLVARNKNVLEDSAKEIVASGGSAKIFPTDLTDESKLGELIDFTVAEYGGIDILVHCAGIIATGSIEDTTVEDWDYMMNLNLRSVFILTQKALPWLIERKGNIVNVSSVTGLRSFPNILSYCVSKAGLDQFTRCTALELGPKGVRVNAVNPGVTITQLHRSGGMDEDSYQNFLEHSKTTHPIGRVGKADEVADLILFLASPHAGWVTGVTYSIDGGRAQTCAR